MTTSESGVGPELTGADIASIWQTAEAELAKYTTPGEVVEFADELSKSGLTSVALAALERGMRRFGPVADLLQARAQMLATELRHLEALEVIDWCLDLDPDRPRALVLRAIALSGLDRDSDLQPVLDRLLTFDTDDPWVRLAKVHIAMLSAQPEIALTEVDRLLVETPSEPDLLKARYGALQALERDDAADAAAQWLAVAPDDVDALAAVARSAAGDDPAAMLAAWQQVLDRAPSNIEARVAHARALLAANEAGDAVAELDALLEDEPDNADALRWRGEGLRLLNRFEEAVAPLTRAIELDPNTSWAIATYGQVLAALGKHEDAVVQFDRAIELGEDSQWMHSARSESLRMLGRYEEAVVAAKAAGHDQVAMGSLGDSLRELDRNDEALTALNDAIASFGETAFLVGTRGQVYLALDRYEEAIADLSRARDLDPALTWIRLSLVDALRVAERYDEALEQSDELIELDQDDSMARAERAETLRALGRVTEALSEADLALARQADNWFAAGTRARALYDNGMNADALVAADEVLRLKPDYTFALQTRIFALNALERSTEALEECQRYKTLADDLTGAEMEAVTFVLLGRSEETLDVVRNTTFSSAYLGYCEGVALIRTGRFDEAERPLRAVMEDAGDDDPWTLSELSDCLHRRGRRDGDEKATADGDELSKQVADAARKDAATTAGFDPAGWCMIKLGDLENAVRFLKLAPSQLSTQWILHLAQLAGGQHRHALAAIDSWFTDLAGLQDRGRAYGIVREAHLALSTLRELEKLGDGTKHADKLLGHLDQVGAAMKERA